MNDVTSYVVTRVNETRGSPERLGVQPEPVRTYGPGPVQAACERALDLDVVDVTKIARMLELGWENEPPPPVAGMVVGGPARFARDTTEFEVIR